ncbi:4-hydroxybenzoate octaprenyltransferase [Aliiglaciecola sp. 3_MG-2023]|uniref:4-hydroxybenzoate octaprenyltransferase n=1 Tax=Aliiglaciecola sp. 3_MG-2023 TaxID=3062644 RepID=UPI0026E2F987|nr:4-hydroxybenzoate octaprenyltransferase [Aliiglaciecola sp. 3_MG-2023]MDO6693024.1 4-hydroxybenzoate octaprenyltransferase [Aliiglaciecola sp. 3_MG-2023]
MTKSKFNAFVRLARMDKPIGSYLLLWPTLWALLIAGEGYPPLEIVVVFIAGVFAMRSAGCVINDYADRHVDGKVERTKSRPLVSGEVTEKEALLFFSVLVFISFLLVLTLNYQTILLSFGALALASIYPFMKRFTNLPQVVLGAAFSWAIPMAFMAVNEQIHWIGWVLFFINVIWTVGYDTEYAMVDRDDDLQIGVKSTAVLFAQADKLAIGITQLVTLVLLGFVAYTLNMTWPMYMSLLVMAGLFIYQQYLIKDRIRANCFQAFLNNHYAGMIVAIGMLCHYWL